MEQQALPPEGQRPEAWRQAEHTRGREEGEGGAEATWKYIDTWRG